MTDENRIVYVGSCDSVINSFPRYSRDRFYHILRQNKKETIRNPRPETDYLQGDGVTLEDLARLEIN